ncbi:TonB-dependent receptor [Alteromonas sp. ASW11-36]|uniref:TonB-dependent receptor n=1 Tax=Alteromonas arenosi TaxID=3055817 RepID=A0ABT7SSU7_9ALTE|nr:TonB-dependent receptor [Alteromonas sp. ASW11-36]MDM7859269.1 TonB-dependent receptor [Alteromonas sp. ASW11-36]
MRNQLQCPQWLYHGMVVFILFHAASSFADELQWNGFIAQGVQRAEGSNFINDDGDLSFALTEVGINGRIGITDHISANGQVVYLNAGDRFPQGVRVDYLFIDWHAVRGVQFNLNVHLGRYKNYHWLYSSTRDVPHTRPSNVLPQSIYFDSFRDVALGSDGIALRANTLSDTGEWEINWSYGRSSIGSESTRQLLGHMASGDIEQDFVHQASVYWSSSSNTLTLGANWLDSDFSYESDAQDPFVDGFANVERISLAAQYQSQYWEFTSEIMRESSLYQNAISNGFFSDSTAEGGYVQILFMPQRRLSLLSRIDLYDLNREDRNGNQLNQLSGGQTPNYFGYMDTATIGLKYAIWDNVNLQLEYNRVRGAGRLTPLLVRDIHAVDEEYWDLWSVQMMYWF